MKHSTKLKAILMLVGTVLLAFSLPLLAQERFGNIGGLVKDSTGAVVLDAAVTVTNVESQRALTAKTRTDGTYSLANIEPGRYTLSISKKGFRRYEVKDLLVVLGKTTNVDAAIEVGAATEVVEVSGAAEQIDISSTMAVHNVIAEDIDRLPKARDIQNIAVFSPSVNTGQIEGGYQINGASAAENAYYIDGVATNSVIDGSARQNPTFDYVQEVQVKTTGLEAEFGGAMGGVVTAVTKSGGNAFHGDVHYYYYGSKLSAGPTKRLQVDRSVAPSFNAPVQYFQDDKPVRHNNEIGGSFSGPIVKDKLWFYTAASPRWTTRRNQYVFTQSDGTPFNYTMNQNADQMNWFSKLSYQPTERVRLNLSWLYTPTYSKGSMPVYSGWGKNQTTIPYETALGSSTSGYNQAENSVSGQVTYTLSNTSILNVEGGRYYLNYKETGIPYSSSIWYRTSSIGMADVPTDMQQIGTWRTPDAGQVFHDLSTRTYVQTTLSKIANFAGQHNLKFGVGTQKNVNNADTTDYGTLGRVSIYWGQDQKVKGKTGQYGYYAVDAGGTTGSAGSNITHLYVQDSWKILRRLTINPGIRVEKETVPSFRPDIQKYAFQFGFGDKIAPRIGAAFDVLGNGRLKVSGGWGRFYDWTKFDLSRGTFGGDKWITYYRTIDNPSLFKDAKTGMWLVNVNHMPGTNLWPGAYRDHRIPGFDYIDKSVKPMSADTMNAGVEWEFKDNFLLTGRFVRNSLNRTIEDIGALDSTGSETYFYGNPGEGLNKIGFVTGATCMVKTDTGKCGYPIPKPKRVYDAMELSVEHRFGHGWQGNISYVYSKLYGNYSGLQSTDEIRPASLGYSFSGNQAFTGTATRPGGNASRYYDLDETMFDAHGDFGNYGRLPTDRPHVLKFYGSKQFKFGTQIGAFFRVQSGTPLTTQMVTANDIPVYVEGRGDMGRTPVFSQTDLVVSHELKLGKDESKRLRFEFNAMNLFNQKTSMFSFDRYNFEENYDSGPDLSGVDLAKGFNWKSMVDATGLRDPRYGKAAMFNPGFDGRVMIKFIF